MSVSFATAQSHDSPPLVQISEASSGIELEVTDPTGSHVQGALISLSTKNPTSLISGGTTDANGKWQIRGISSGQYWLFINANAPGLYGVQDISVGDHNIVRLQVQMQAVVVMGEVVRIEPTHNPVKKLVRLFKSH